MNDRPLHETTIRTTVVIPCFNDGATIGAAVRSIDEREPIRVVIVDDGSTDQATVATIDALESERVHVARQTNAGVAAALRRGFETATTPYVFVLAADDLLEAGALGDLADALDANPQAAFAYGHSHHFGDVDQFRPAAPWNPWILLHTNLWEACCLFRRDAVIAVGGFPDDSGYEDWELFMALAERDKAGVLVDRLVFHYRLHGTGRINAQVKRGFARHFNAIRGRHAALFAREAEFRQTYPLPVWVRLFYEAQLTAGLHLPAQAVPAILEVKRRFRPLANRIAPAKR